MPGVNVRPAPLASVGIHAVFVVPMTRIRIGAGQIATGAPVGEPPPLMPLFGNMTDAGSVGLGVAGQAKSAAARMIARRFVIGKRMSRTGEQDCAMIEL